MHNYLKQKSCAYVFPQFKTNFDKMRINNHLTIKKGITSSISNSFSISINKNECFSSLNSNTKNKNYRFTSSLINNKNKLIKIPHKNFYERKSLKWYWREKTYDMLDGDIYKNYLIKFKNNFHMELIPQNLPDGKTYDSCLIWLYDGDFPQYFLEHLLEFNNFPPKVTQIFFSIFKKKIQNNKQSKLKIFFYKKY